MKYNSVIRKAIFLRRPNRFQAYVVLDDEELLVHVPNTGRCREILKEGCTVLLRKGTTPNRKTPYDLIAAYKGEVLINIDSQIPNKVVEEALINKKIEKLVNFNNISREKTFGNSRFDFKLQDDNENTYFLEVKGVKKKLGKREIIKGLDLSVNEGEIFGFLGPNGAGKTTTIRMLVGLISPNEGEIVVCGKSVLSEKEQALKNVGAVVENPELYKYLSGRENLMQIARIRKLSKEEVEELIDLVGLKDRIDDKVRKYSLGMKQRLGLAAALIGDPKLLILDEPTNGLDPSGIIDFRDVVKKASRERGMAVFISSHILSEVQNLCDRVAFINNGVIKSVEDIHDNSMETELDSLTLVVSSNKEQAIKVLKDIGFVNSSTVIDEEIHIIVETGKTTELLKVLLENNVLVEEIYKNRKGLEQRYMELVEGGIR